MVLIKTHIKTIKLEDANHNILGEIQFDMSDENVKRLDATIRHIEKETSNYTSEADFGKFLKMTIDEILGNGTFDMLYQLSPSLLLTAVNFNKIADEIKYEIQKETKAFVKDKFVGKRKKRRGK